MNGHNESTTINDELLIYKILYIIHNLDFMSGIVIVIAHHSHRLNYSTFKYRYGRQFTFFFII